MPLDSDLLGLTDIARLAGVRRNVVANWRDRHADFPKPAEQPGSGPLYRRDEVAAWLEAKRPQTKKVQPLGFEAQLWKAADALRNNMDAAEYKHVVLGLIFLKYISDSFEERRQEILAQVADPASEYHGDEAAADDRDEYLRRHVFWVPAEARWERLRDGAKQPTIGKLVDDAMVAIERDNPRLKGVLPKDYARPTLDWQRLGQLIDLISGIGVGGVEARDHDVLGRVYEYFLSEFAAAEGKRGGEFYTPRSVVRLLVEMIEPYHGRIYDPCCGSGGMFVQSVRFIEAHGGKRSDVAIYGQESNPTTWRLAAMNLAIRGIEAQLGKEHADSFRRDIHPDLRADFILANPPFNDSHWNGELMRDDVRWKFGVPPVGNANFAWIEHFVHHLAPGGRAAFILANNAANSADAAELEIRRNLVQHGLIECVVALPNKLFYSRGLSVSLWIIRKGPRPNGEEVLLVDARGVGHLVDRTHRDLDDADVTRISSAYHNWITGEGSFAQEGFSQAVSTDAVLSNGASIWPPHYLRDAAQESEDVVGELVASSSDWISQLRNALNAAAGVPDQLAALTADASFERHGWETRRLGDVSNYLARGIQPRYCERGGVVVLNQKCVREGEVVWEKARRHDPAARSVEGREITSGDILINSTGVGTLGRVAVVRSIPEKAVVDSHVTILRPDRNLVNPEFLGLLLRLLEPDFERLAVGSTGQTELSKTRISDMRVLLPPRSLQDSIAGFAAPLLDLCEVAGRSGVLRRLLEAIVDDIRVPAA